MAGEGGFEEGAWNYSSPGPRRPVPRTQWVPKYSSKEQAALFRAQSVALWQSCQPGLQGKSQWSPPRTMQKFQPFPPPHTGPGSEAAPRASGRPPLPPLPAAPACLSAGITLRNSFTRPPKSALQPAAPSCWQPNLCQVAPAREKRKSWPGVQWPKEEGRPSSLPERSVMHLAVPGLQRPEQVPGIPRR